MLNTKAAALTTQNIKNDILGRGNSSRVRMHVWHASRLEVGSLTPNDPICGRGGPNISGPNMNSQDNYFQESSMDDSEHCLEAKYKQKIELFVSNSN